MGLKKTMRLIAFISLLSPATLFAQSPTKSSATSRQKARQEIEGVIVESGSLNNKLDYVKVRARAAGLLWRLDAERARKLLNELWDWVAVQDDKEFGREEARTELLKIIFVKDSALATKLLESLQEGIDKGVSPSDEIPDTRRLNGLTSALIEDDPKLAAKFLERSLSVNFTPANMELLSLLKRRESGLANDIASRILDRQMTLPTDNALSAMYALTEYVFPARRNNDSLTQGDAALQRQFFLTANDILSRLLRESGGQQQNGTGPDLSEFRQAHLIGILSALAARYAPDRVAELNELAAKSFAKLPPQEAELARYTMERIKGNRFRPAEASPAADISRAIMDEDFDGARRLLNKIEREDVRKILDYQIATGEFKSLMAKADFTRALLIARGIEVPQAKAYMFAQIAKATYKKGDVQFTKLLLAEARASLSNLECNERRALANFYLASATTPVSYEDSLDLIIDGVACINSLEFLSSEKSNLNTGDSGQIYVSSLQQAFSSVGKVNLAMAISMAGRIENRPLRLLAKLSASEVWMDRTKEEIKKPSPPQGLSTKSSRTK